MPACLFVADCFAGRRALPEPGRAGRQSRPFGAARGRRLLHERDVVRRGAGISALPLARSGELEAAARHLGDAAELGQQALLGAGADQLANQFLLYYVAQKKGGPLAVAVARASRPEGPYKDLGQPVAQRATGAEGLRLEGDGDGPAADVFARRSESANYRAVCRIHADTGSARLAAYGSRANWVGLSAAGHQLRLQSCVEPGQGE